MDITLQIWVHPATSISHIKFSFILFIVIFHWDVIYNEVLETCLIQFIRLFLNILIDEDRLVRHIKKCNSMVFHWHVITFKTWLLSLQVSQELNTNWIMNLKKQAMSGYNCYCQGTQSSLFIKVRVFHCHDLKQWIRK